MSARPRPTACLLLAVLLVALAAASLALTRWPPQPAPAPAGSPAAGAVVSRTVLGCPPAVRGRGARTAVRLGLAPVGVRGGGAVLAGPTTTDLGRGEVSEVPRVDGPVRADGAAAVGLFGFRTERRTTRSLGVTPCTTPATQWWFTGAGAGPDHSSTLFVSNLDSGPAVVHLRVLGRDGAVHTVGTSGIVVRPSGTVRVRLADVAAQPGDLTLGVLTDRGRVLAAVSDSTPAGQEWLPGSDGPSRTPVLSGLPASAGHRTLLVANPSGLDAVVDVRVSTRSGTFTPTGVAPVTVAPGAVRTLDLRGLPATEPVTVRLRSQVAVLGSVRSTVRGDQAYAAPVTSLRGPAVAPLLGTATATLQVTAGPTAASARVTAYDARGRRTGGTTLRIGPAATAAWSPARGASYLVVVPAGDVSGAVSYHGSGVAAVPLTALPVRAPRAEVRPDLW